MNNPALAHAKITGARPGGSYAAEKGREKIFPLKAA
jgi:hypothetical protein